VAAMLKTTSTTLSQFKTEIKWDDLPKTFHDAVTICRRLDVEYIWIDALCIIQDSEPDWQNQASKMASNFENVYFTIAATKAKDSSQGFFFRNQPPVSNPSRTGPSNRFR
jgi:hypothetical protein